jgi:BirA family biotin operon repressor/biotin-[acetyl-CoA-carboxylase] ligase
MADEIIGNNLIELDITDSTNEYSKKLIKKGPVEEGTVILADFQTKGKGQKDGYWESEKGKNLTFSIILYPNFLDIQKQFYLSMSISIGIVEFLSHLSVKSKIKWPNDICINNKKVAGILIENSIKRNIISSSIIGIGINVNQTEFKSSAPNPTSLYLELNKTFDIKNTYHLLISYLNRWIKLLHNSHYKKIKSIYKKNLFLINKKACFTDINGKFDGRIIDVEESGILLIKTDSKKVRKYNFKEVSFPC